MLSLNRNLSQTGATEKDKTGSAALCLDDPWCVVEADFPLHGTDDAKLRFLLNYAILAPSSHNAQPWLWKLKGDAVELYADHSRSLPVADPRDRELLISCGAALFNLRLAIWHFRYRPEVRTFPDPSNPDLLAHVRLGNRRITTEPASDERALFEAICRRHTNRMQFQDRELPPSLLQQLKDAARSERAVLLFVTNEERDAVVGLIEHGDVLQGHNHEFRSELADWMRPDDTTARDGIPGEAMGLGGLISHIAPAAIRVLDIGQVQASKDYSLIENAPTLALLETEEDTPRGWLAAGQALSHVLLLARTHGVYASFFNQPIEVGELWQRLRRQMGLSLFPQLLFRLGYAHEEDELTPTARRRVDEVLMNETLPDDSV